MNAKEWVTKKIDRLSPIGCSRFSLRNKDFTPQEINEALKQLRDEGKISYSLKEEWVGGKMIKTLFYYCVK